MRFPLVVFDLDGTLVDSLPDIAGALNHALGLRALPPLPLATVRTLVGDGVHVLVERALATCGAPLSAAPAVTDEVRRYYLAHACVETRPYASIEPTLATLRARGHQLAVLTNKPGDIARQLLSDLRLDAAFAAVIGDGDGLPRKPDPTALLALCQRFSTPPGETLMVGDGLPDVAIAHAARVPVAAAAWGYTDRALLAAQHPTHLLDDPATLLTLC